MKKLINKELNQAQQLIYSKSNIRRAFNDFDDSDIAGLYMQDRKILIVRTDGSEQDYPIEPIQTAYRSYTGRLKHFFSYFGPNMRGPSLWKYNSYVIFKGWVYSHELGKHNPAVKYQQLLCERLSSISNLYTLVSFLQSEQTDIGHHIAPDGFVIPSSHGFSIKDEDEEDEELDTPKASDPFCSCGSFQNQSKLADLFEQEIPGHKPTCIHMTWFKRYRDFLGKRTEVQNNAPRGVITKAVAWWYKPPSDGNSKGEFFLVYTKEGVQAPINRWHRYKPQEQFTEDHAWDLFDNMMEAGYTPFQGSQLPQLSGLS